MRLQLRSTLRKRPENRTHQWIFPAIWIVVMAYLLIYWTIINRTLIPQNRESTTPPPSSLISSQSPVYQRLETGMPHREENMEPAGSRANSIIFFKRTIRSGGMTVSSILLRYAVRSEWEVLDDKDLYTRVGDNFPSITIASSKPLDAKVFYQDKMAARRSVYITVLREPANTHESFYMRYLGWCSGQPHVTAYMRNLNYRYLTPDILKSLCDGKNISVDNVHNMISYSLGLPISDMSSPDLVSQFVLDVDRQFQLVMITELMDESLIMLRDLMNWETADVVTFTKAARVEENITTLPPELMETFNRWNNIDKRLYNHFHLKLYRKIKQNETYYRQEVRKLQKLRDGLYDDCVEKQVLITPPDLPPNATLKEIWYLLKTQEKTNPECTLRAHKPGQIGANFVN